MPGNRLGDSLSSNLGHPASTTELEALCWSAFSNTHCDEPFGNRRGAEAIASQHGWKLWAVQTIGELWRRLRDSLSKNCHAALADAGQEQRCAVLSREAEALAELGRVDVDSTLFDLECADSS